MARQKNFEDAEVLQGIADQFSAHGYNGTSMHMLADASGVGKQSLYNSFGDKRQLYLRAVDCAVSRFACVRDEMDTAPDGRRALHVFFERLLCDCLSADPAVQSCIVSSGLLEDIDDAEIAATLRSKWAGTHALLRDAVARGQADGSITSSAPAAELADLLMALMSGLRVSSRAIDAPARLQRTVARALALLDDPPGEI